MEMLNVDTYPTQIEIHTLCKRNLLNILYTEYTGCNSITCQPEKFNGSGATKNANIRMDLSLFGITFIISLYEYISTSYVPIIPNLV